MKKEIWMLILSILAGLLVIITSIAQYNKEKSDKIELGKKDKEIKDLLYKNIDSVSSTNAKITEINNLQQKINSLQDELLISNKYISSQTEENKNTITGGDSRPILSLFFGGYFSDGKPNDNFYSVQFQIVNKDKYPIRSLRCKINDSYEGIIKVSSKNPDGSMQVQIDPSVSQDSHVKNLTFETLANTSGYVDLYKSRILKDLETFWYHIDIQWLTGIAVYDISGKIDQQTKRIYVTDIKVFPSKENANPLGYLELFPQNVGSELKHFKNFLDVK